MASSENTTSEHLAELIRLQAERARANGHKPGQMVEGAEVMVIRRNPETGRKEFGLLKWGFVAHWAPDTSRPHLHARAEFKLLLVLTVLEKAVLSREELRDFLWPADTAIDARSVDVLVTRLRHNLQSARVPLTVISVRSAGYMMGRTRDEDCCIE